PEGVEVRARAAALARVGLGSLEQPTAPSLLPAILVHPEELDVQPRGPDVAEHPAANPALLVAQEDRDRVPVVAARHDDVPAVEPVAQRLLLAFPRLLPPHAPIP